MSDSLGPFYTRRYELTAEGNCLLWGTRVVIPSCLRELVLKELHQGHRGMSRMKALARSYLWWPNLDKDIEHVAGSCSSCQTIRQAPPRAPMHPWTWPLRPWQRVHIDFAGPFEGKMFLVIHSHSKWGEVREMSSTTTLKTIEVLRELFSSFGLPEQLVSDNGPQFTSEQFVKFIQSNKIRHIRCSPYHPSSNGFVERFVRSFKEAMKASRNDGLSLRHSLANFLLCYCSMPQATTGQPPSSLFLGRSLRTTFDLLCPDIESKVVQKQAAQRLSSHNIVAYINNK